MCSSHRLASLVPRSPACACHHCPDRRSSTLFANKGPASQTLRLEWNMLSGTIPPSFALLPALGSVSVSPGNYQLCGGLPEGARFQLCRQLGSYCQLHSQLGSTCSQPSLVADLNLPPSSADSNELLVRLHCHAQDALLCRITSLQDLGARHAPQGCRRQAGCRLVPWHVWPCSQQALCCLNLRSVQLLVCLQLSSFSACSIVHKYLVVAQCYAEQAGKHTQTSAPCCSHCVIHNSAGFGNELGHAMQAVLEFQGMASGNTTAEDAVIVKALAEVLPATAGQVRVLRSFDAATMSGAAQNLFLPLWCFHSLWCLLVCWASCLQ